MPAFSRIRSKSGYLKNLAVPLCIILFIICLVKYSNTAIASALKAVNLWLDVVLPSIFPFLVASEILNQTGFIKSIGYFFEPVMRPIFNLPGSASYPFVLGLVSGYPIGAKATAGIRRDKLISKSEAERLLAFCNNASPLFITGAVSTAMLKAPFLGPLLLICHIASSVTIGILFGFAARKNMMNRKIKTGSYSDNYNNKYNGNGNKKVKYNNNGKKAYSVKTYAISSLLRNAVVNSMATMLSIGGFIILFSIISGILAESGIFNFIKDGNAKHVLTAIVSGFLEITTGLSKVCELQDVSSLFKLVLISIFTGWGGMSVHSQVLNAINDTDLSIKVYLLGKIMQSILAGAYTYIGLKITGFHLLMSDLSREASIILHVPGSAAWKQYLITSCKYLLIFLIFTLLIDIFSYNKIRFLKNKKSS